MLNEKNEKCLKRKRKDAKENVPNVNIVILSGTLGSEV
jgi:hypothetical protein